LGSLTIVPYGRHPELGSGSIAPLVPTVAVARWMLKQVQHDEKEDKSRFSL
jgi:hypothetical protein